MQKILPVFKKGRFYNGVGELRPAMLLPSVAWYFQSLMMRYVDRQRLSARSVEHFSQLGAGKSRMVWLGHATFLLQMGMPNAAPVSLLTDPVFGGATPLFSRACPLGVELAQLPVIDYVLISHNHRDHLDERSIAYIIQRNPAAIFLVPLGDAAWFVRRGITRVHELSWWETHTQAPVRCTFLPAYHWSGRSLTDYNCSLWGSWLIQWGGQTIFFGGDTAYGNHFASIARYAGPIDSALLPIGPCEPARYMRSSHVSGQWVVRAFLELGARVLVPMHWGTFFFGTDRVFTPLEQLQQAWQLSEMHLSEKVLQVVQPGQLLEFDERAQLMLEQSARVSLP